MSTAALLLAAGESRRMGRLKALLPWEGTSLIEYQIHQLREAGIDQVLVALGHAAADLLPLVAAIPGVEPLVNPDYISGKASSIRLAMTHLSPQAEALTVLAVDQPRPASVLRRLLSEHTERQALISVPTYKGRRGHPTIIARAVFSELATVSEKGQGLRRVMGLHDNRIQEVAVEDPTVVLDLNTPADYIRGLRLLGGADLVNIEERSAELGLSPTPLPESRQKPQKIP